MHIAMTNGPQDEPDPSLGTHGQPSCCLGQLPHRFLDPMLGVLRYERKVQYVPLRLDRGMPPETESVEPTG